MKTTIGEIRRLLLVEAAPRVMVQDVYRQFPNIVLDPQEENNEFVIDDTGRLFMKDPASGWVFWGTRGWEWGDDPDGSKQSAARFRADDSAGQTGIHEMYDVAVDAPIDAGVSLQRVAEDIQHYLNELEDNVTGAQAEIALDKLQMIVDYLTRRGSMNHDIKV